MATPTIGGFAFNAWKGLLAYGGPRTTQYEQGGIPGYGVVFGGLKTDPQMITTVYRASSGLDATNAVNSYRAAITSSVTVVDPIGVSWSQVLILDCHATISLDPIGYMVTAIWNLLPASN